VSKQQIKTLKIIETDDGSQTLWVPGLSETYHSKFGALTESTHVFIEQGLEQIPIKKGGNPIKILEIGFGTGLNALLTWEHAISKKVRVHYTALEPYPIPASLIKELHYGQLLETRQDGENLFQQLHQASWNDTVSLDQYMEIHKLQHAVQSYASFDKIFDLVYFDAFGPGKQPDMWDREIFAGIYNMMSDEAILVTYCAQGQFKRALKSLGFQVESLPGPPGKFEMVRARKSS